MVDLPYEKDFDEKHNLTKLANSNGSRSENEIQNLLSKKFISNSRYSWSCATFYVNKKTLKLKDRLLNLLLSTNI